jgi:hypothetical protein
LIRRGIPSDFDWNTPVRIVFLVMRKRSSTKHQSKTPTKRRSKTPAKVSTGELLRQMSAVISLREKVAQAELNARIYATERSVLQGIKLSDQEGDD